MSLPSTIFGRAPVGRPARVQLGENMRGGASEFQRRLGGDRLDIRDAAHAVRSKNFLLLRHGAN